MTPVTEEMYWFQNGNRLLIMEFISGQNRNRSINGQRCFRAVIAKWTIASPLSHAKAWLNIGFKIIPP